MTRISNLSQDLIEEILSRVPLTSQRAATSTCKQWNGFYKDESFTKKHRGKAAHDTMEIMVYDSRVRLVRVDLQGVLKRKQGLVELSKKLIGQLNHIMVSDDDGLLLSLPKNGMVKSDPVVWNPYLGQVRWIKPRKQLTISGRYRYCMGYSNKNNHKILRFLYHYNGTTVEHEIFNFKSDSWRRFRRCLDLDANSRSGDSVILSVVREEQLAVLFYRDAVILSTVGEERLAVLYHRVDTYEFEIQITTKIEAANEVTWTSFLKVDVKPFVEISWRFPPCGSFFVDKNKKVALIWDNYNCNRAYVIGEDNYFARVALGESQCWPLVCSYVPSSVQIQRSSTCTRQKESTETRLSWASG
ncbi:putative F-box protein At5g51000 [Brassica napus]|uniref:putative F-box protein At5g51000 n=1 Tax=Brassica napus TaxID=3708 RepID=UPI002079C0B9|nr:putative F-box protein At5g51000 [Brassica napus]